MKAALEELLKASLQVLAGDLLPDQDYTGEINLERTRDPRHGDFATNAAMLLARHARMNPRQLAEHIIASLPESPLVQQVEIAGPGFINFFLAPVAYREQLTQALAAGEQWGHSDMGAGRRVQVEFVSANPTGPLHVGHGRGAAYGASVANILAAAGYDVHREYYVNDAGRQMDILAASVWLRYLEHCEELVDFPANGYRGTYIRDIAEQLKGTHGERFYRPADEVMQGLPDDEPRGGDKEAHIDALIARSRELLGEEDFRLILDAALEAILADIRDDLEEFGVSHDEWFPERQLVDDGAVEQTLARLEGKGLVYEQDGARWFRSSDFGDDKDRVVVRDNGVPTYFASDIAYHLNKLERGYEQLIDIWGADHHGYVPRVRAGLRALDLPEASLDVLLVQFAILWRGDEKVQMSTRSGDFVTLRELRHEVGNDAARFFYVMRSNEQHLDFDLELAKSRTNENPVYYIQYAHARIQSVFDQLETRGGGFDARRGESSLGRLDEDHEMALMVEISRYPEVLEQAARNHAPHTLAHYLRELAGALHTYYNAHTFLVDDEDLRDARLCLCLATRHVLRNGLGLLGVSAPDDM